jgi:MIP family channel proteins
MHNNRYVAEAFATFALVFVGCGAIIVNDLFAASLGHVGISLVFGLIVMAMIYAVGNISGAHLNPAVSLGFYFAGRFPARLLPGYVASQLLGALFAAGLLKLLFPEHANLGMTIVSIALWKALLIEIVITFLLMFTILNVSTGHQEKGIMAGVAVGAVIALMALFAGPLTGASMNPARSLAPALFAWQGENLWLYVLGPGLGAWLAHPACRWIQGPDCCAEPHSNADGE